MISESEPFDPRLARRRRLGVLFASACAGMVVLAIAVLGVLLVSVAQQGWRWLSWDFLTHFPSRLNPERAGVKSALFGTLWLIGLTAVVSVPTGMAAAIYLHEYARKNRLTRFIELNIANLAGVPSIVYGILGLAVFIRLLGLGRSIIAGALTLSLLIFPVVIITSREALAAVPDSIRQAAFGLGATRWQTVRAHVLPAALPGMMTGVILALSRAIGEAAPLIMIGALTFIAFVPDGPMDAFTALPIQIYNWCDQPDAIFHELAGAGILVLLGLLLPMNAVAVGIRAWHERRKARPR
ncbi:MAG: phosphate ABC transporter permease PstA [Dehalococcoidia bacterium]